ncbi:hypothetical protein [Streptomyces lunaelactis]|uniref:hypothetical protein n=1 Tax=Streptomyces lunaelactis TaxID=1535768 RepID=UPI001584671B|nr:hypothetical protein [Streptomyces lunaelactis]NUK05513.1 hypothetical protein [Streptomyces lunaelactis]NUK20738.1 hypothetical protein [Streptomyces lunaelactis]
MAAIFIFFLGMLIHNRLNSADGDLGQSLVIFAAIAIPGGFVAAWLAGAGRRRNR